MWFLVVVVGFVAVLVALGLWVDRRDRRADRQHRDSQSIWTDEVRENRRDLRALRSVRWLGDISWTRQSRRGR